ncbi:MAG TPA: hypothetical protein VFZ24_02295 [Longimicrobiales bacterium]
MRAHRIAALLVLALVTLVPGAAAAQQTHDHASHSPYSGMQSRDIKALDSAAVQDYLTGAGMGFALAAELNGHPGPRHVLELADQLRLTEAQREATSRIFDGMQREATALGEQIVELERELDRRFAHRHIDAQTLDELTGKVALLNGRLRAVHLRAHIEQTALLTGEQITLYQRLRGYE